MSRRASRSFPDGAPTDRFAFERSLQQQGFRRIAGIDEAGRGPLAGPVMAAAVMLPLVWLTQGLPSELQGLNDSKQLKAAQREAFFDTLTRNPAIGWAVAEASVEEVDRDNILRATHQAMQRALSGLGAVADHVLVDGRRVGELKPPQTAIVRGDAQSFSIAAASVLAKVSRDRQMMEYDREYPLYGFARHKGYGTAEHLEAIRRHGPCPLHRRSFAPLKPTQGEFF